MTSEGESAWVMSLLVEVERDRFGLAARGMHLVTLVGRGAEITNQMGDALSLPFRPQLKRFGRSRCLATTANETKLGTAIQDSYVAAWHSSMHSLVMKFRSFTKMILMARMLRT